MKLFKQLLAAPAAIGVLVGSMEVKADDFTPTTSLSGEANFTYGQSTIEANPNHEIHNVYSFTINSMTSFTGKDALLYSLETGNYVDGTRLHTDSTVIGGDSLNVTSLYYTAPITDELLFAVGPLFAMDALVSTTTSSYSNDGLFNGWWYGPNNLSNHPKDGSPGFALAYVNDSGFNLGLSHINVDGTDSSNNKGLLNKESDQMTTLSMGYDGEIWGTGLIYTLYDDPSNLFVNVRDANGNSLTGVQMGSPVFIGVGAYWNVNDKLDVSVGADVLDFDYLNYDVANVFSIGADYDLGENGRLSAGLFTVPSYDTATGDQDNAGTAYEVYYTYDVADNITIKPMVLVHALDSSGTINWADETIMAIETSFKF